MKLFDKWKQEWLDKNELKLAKQFEPNLDELKRNFESTLSDWKKKKLELEEKITFELEDISKKQTNLITLSQNLEIKEISFKHKELSLENSLKELEKSYSEKLKYLDVSFNQAIINFESKRKLVETKISSQTTQLESDYKGLEDIQKSYCLRKKQLESQDKEISEQLKLIEAKTSPSNSWLSGFSMGYSKAWDTMFPFMQDGLKRVHKQIEDNATNKVLEGLNGNHKTNY